MIDQLIVLHLYTTGGQTGQTPAPRNLSNVKLKSSNRPQGQRNLNPRHPYTMYAMVGNWIVYSINAFSYFIVFFGEFFFFVVSFIATIFGFP